MESREIAEACEKAAHLCLNVEALGKQIKHMDIHVTYWCKEAEHNLGELVAVLNERLRNKEVK